VAFSFSPVLEGGRGRRVNRLITTMKGEAMKDYTLRLYSFDELDEEGKEKAIYEMQNRLHEWIGEEELTDHLNL